MKKQKVEICGINTATLPKITNDESNRLIALAQQGDQIAKDKFVTANLRLVLSLVQKFYGKKQSIDDIFQVGCVGLIKAMENFNLSYNLRFSTYAVPMIIGEIRRFLRDSSAVRVSRSIRDTAYKALQVRSDLENASDREVTYDEIAACMDISTKQVTYALDAISDPVSLYDPAYHDGDEAIMIMDQICDESGTDNWMRNLEINEALDKLDMRERQILELRYYDGKTQMEVSNEIGISQAQVSRLEKSAINQMHKRIC